METLLLTKDQLRQKIKVEDYAIDKEGITINTITTIKHYY